MMNDFLTASGILSLGIGSILLIFALLLTIAFAVLHVLSAAGSHRPLLLQVWKWCWLAGALLLLVGSGLCGLKLHFYPFYQLRRKTPCFSCERHCRAR